MTDLDDATAIAAHFDWLGSEDPARAWYRAWLQTADRKPRIWMARQLRIDPRDPRAWFATAGFAPIELEGVWHIAAPTWAPDPFDPDSLPEGDIIAVDPEKRTAFVLGDPGDRLVLPEPQPEPLLIQTDPVAWLREWADARVIWLETRVDARRRGRIIPAFHHAPPSALVIGDLKNVSWGAVTAKTIRADFSHAAAIKRAIFRSAHLPSVEAA